MAPPRVAVHVEQGWLGEFVEVPALQALATALMEAGVEIEHVADPSANSDGVVVATIASCRAHPDASHLTICEVDDGAARHQVVCGARNVTAGVKVAYARPGARVGKVTLAAKALRGVQSAGMLCGRQELGLPALEDGLWLLQTPLGNGASIAPLLLARRSLELGVTPNRADLLGHMGIAREVAAGSGQRLLPSKWRLHEAGPAVQTLCRVQIDEPERARRYVARVVRNVRLGPSPAWLAERLLAVGQRPINNVVDVTNYVMLELGTPLHAFDLRNLTPDDGGAGNALPIVKVRAAQQGERFETLDGTLRTLHEDDLVIADGKGPIALAGIMGGARSQVTQETSDVLIEAAVFAPESVRQTARRQGMRTEASHRFVRGVDAAMVARAAERAAQLLHEVAGGEVAKGNFDVQKKNVPDAEILLRLRRVEQILGIALSPETLVSLLEPLQIRCTRRTEAALIFAPPSFRPDLYREIDLIEEVARRHGLDQLPARLPAAGSLAEVPRARARAISRTGARARDALLAAGLVETVHFAFASDAMLAPFAAPAQKPVAIVNPLGEEQSLLRTTLLPALLGSVRRNLRRGAAGFKAFEVGAVFWQKTAEMRAATVDAHPKAALDRDLPQQFFHVACVMSGPREPGSLYAAQAPVTAADLKGVWEALSAAYDADAHVSVRAVVDGTLIGPFNPYAAAQLWLQVPGAPERLLGVIGQLDPAYLRREDIDEPVFALEVDVGRLEALPARRVQAPRPAKFPGTRRDVAVVAPVALPAESVRSFLAARAAQGLGSAVSVEVSIFDVYAGHHVPEGHVSLAFSLFYRSREGSLAEADVAPAFVALLSDVRQTFGVDVRDGSQAAAS